MAEEQVHGGDLPTLAGETWLSVTKSAEDALDGLVDGGLADRLDYQLERLTRWKKSGNPVASHPLAAERSLSRAASMGRERRSWRFTEYDGNLGQAAEGSSFEQSLYRQPISPTRLEAWATCPFPFFPGERAAAGGAGNSGGHYPHHPAGKGAVWSTISWRTS